VKYEFIKPEYLAKFYANNTKNMELKVEKLQILRLINKLTIKEQFKILYSAEEISQNMKCLVKGNNGFNATNNYIQCKNITNVRISLRYD
jgi:hypothetical protein